MYEDDMFTWSDGNAFGMASYLVWTHSYDTDCGFVIDRNKNLLPLVKWRSGYNEVGLVTKSPRHRGRSATRNADDEEGKRSEDKSRTSFE